MEEVVDAIDHVSGMAPANMAANEEEAVKDYLSTSASSIHITVHLSIFSRCDHAISSKSSTFCINEDSLESFCTNEAPKNFCIDLFPFQYSPCRMCNLS